VVGLRSAPVCSILSIPPVQTASALIEGSGGANQKLQAPKSWRIKKGTTTTGALKSADDRRG